MQKKLEAVINEMEEIDDNSFDSRKYSLICIGIGFISNPEIYLEENKGNEHKEDAKEEAKQITERINSGTRIVGKICLKYEIFQLFIFDF